MDPDALVGQALAGPFIHIPGPNPLLTPGGSDAWDGAIIECADVLKDDLTYYLYYHGEPRNGTLWPTPEGVPGLSYRCGVATAPSPLGPWAKHAANPIVDLGPAGSWEERHVACPAILKEGENRFLMWYSGCDRHGVWSIGLATANHPLGPWTKHAGNPVIADFGYVGGVVKLGGEYRLYSEHPVGGSSPDQGPIALATAEAPAGPWEEHPPVLTPDGWGAWDDGGYSEAKVFYHDGLFHVFYGGTKWKKLEQIGYACSADGVHFAKYPRNPVVSLAMHPDTSAFAEVHALSEPPFLYLYHTLRYASTGYLATEDIGVQVLATSTPFRLPMPLIQVETLSAGESTAVGACPALGLRSVSQLALTVECAYHAEATAGLRLHLRSSPDGIHYDTVDLRTFDCACTPGASVTQTFEMNPAVLWAKVVCENTDPAWPAGQVKITATLGIAD